MFHPPSRQFIPFIFLTTISFVHLSTLSPFIHQSIQPVVNPFTRSFVYYSSHKTFANFCISSCISVISIRTSMQTIIHPFRYSFSYSSFHLHIQAFVYLSIYSSSNVFLTFTHVFNFQVVSQTFFHPFIDRLICSLPAYSFIFSSNNHLSTHLVMHFISTYILRQLSILSPVRHSILLTNSFLIQPNAQVHLCSHHPLI